MEQNPAKRFLEMSKGLQCWLETESCKAYPARQRLYTNPSDSFDSMWDYQGFFCYSTEGRSKANHEHVFQMCVKTSWLPQSYPEDSAFPVFSIPYLRLLHMVFIIKSCQLNFPSLSHRVESLLFHSFWLFPPRENMSREKNGKEL